jgi:hypothetical protein
MTCPVTFVQPEGIPVAARLQRACCSRAGRIDVQGRRVSGLKQAIFQRMDRGAGPGCDARLVVVKGDVTLYRLWRPAGLASDGGIVRLARKRTQDVGLVVRAHTALAAARSHACADWVGPASPR